ncbi:MAG: ribbon-helix-helix protein, CopG family, partial [Bifidobacteriaceae bacterium]|nr:ribbon-helix-helix protein, CopG family [Bifidobacteriaceae bacterium]
EIDQYIDWARWHRADDLLQEISVPLPDSVVAIIDREAARQGKDRLELMRRWLTDKAHSLEETGRAG